MQVVSESVKLPDTKTASKKVASTVATFLNKPTQEASLKEQRAILILSGSFRVCEYFNHKTASEKVASTVATFLNRVSGY